MIKLKTFHQLDVMTDDAVELFDHLQAHNRGIKDRVKFILEVGQACYFHERHQLDEIEVHQIIFREIDQFVPHYELDWEHIEMVYEEMSRVILPLCKKLLGKTDVEDFDHDSYEIKVLPQYEEDTNPKIVITMF